MFSLEIMLLGLALAIDAAVVTFAIGLLHGQSGPGSRFKKGLVISAAFGFFQCLMLWLGSYAGYLFTFSAFGYYFQMGIGMIFLGLALKFFQESMKSGDDKKIEWGFFPMVFLSFFTSIDALISGVSLATLPQAHWAAFEVGVITFAICLLFYFLSHTFKRIPERWLLRLAAIIFIFLGIQVFFGVRHLLKG